MPEKVILSAEEMRRALVRIAHEVVERNRGCENLVLIGVLTRGVPIAKRLSTYIAQFEPAEVPVGSLDIGGYRDDVASKTQSNGCKTRIPVDIADKRVVLVDDVLFTGRSVRAAMDALIDMGRPKGVQLAVLIDRGHRELPIHPDYVGRNIPTSRQEDVRVRLAEVDGRDEVAIARPGLVGTVTD